MPDLSVIEEKNQLSQLVLNGKADTETWFLLGKSCVLTEDFRNGIIYLLEFLRREPDPVKQSYAHDAMGKCLLALDAEEDALKQYNLAIALNPTCGSALNNKALLCVARAERLQEENAEFSELYLDAAADCLYKALKICQLNPMFLHSAARWYEAQIAFLMEHDRITQKQAYEDYRTAVFLYNMVDNPDNKNTAEFTATIYSNLTECYAQFGHCAYQFRDFDYALRLYDRVLQRDPAHTIVLNQVGMCCFKQQKYEQAREFFGRILSVTDEQTEHADAWLNIACAWRHERNLSEANKALTQAEALAPADEYIIKERQDLNEALAASALIAAPQRLFGAASSANESLAVEAPSLHKSI